MKKLKDLKIAESSEEVKGEGEMQWGGIMFRFYFSVGLELNQEWIYQSRTTRAYRLSVAAAVCKSGFVGEGERRRRGLSPPTALIQQLLQSLISLSLLIHLQPSTCFHSQVCFNSHQSVLIKPLPPFSHAARSIFTHKDFETSRSTCVFLPLSLSHSLRYSRLYRPLLNGQISAEKKGGCELPLRLCLYWPTIWAGEEKERGWEGNVSPQSFLRNSTAPKNMCSLVNPLTRWLSLILYQTIKNETTAAVGGTALRSKTDSRKMKWASGHGRAEPKIQSLSPLVFFFSHPSLPVVLWSWLSLSLSCSVHHCQATVTLNQSDSRSVVKLFGRATCATRLLQFGCRRPSDTPTAAGRLCSLQFSGLQESKTQIRVKEKPWRRWEISTCSAARNVTTQTSLWTKSELDTKWWRKCIYQH